MPRVRTVDDEAIFSAVIDVVERGGPTNLTLGAIAAQAGLSAATLVQRFGTKRALLLAADRWAVERWVSGMDAPSPELPALSRLVRGLVHTIDPATSPAELANSVSLLQIGLADPEFHSSTRAGAVRIRQRLIEYLSQAQRDGTLRRDADIDELAILLETTYHGALIAWAIHREGDAPTWVADRLSALLAPFRRSPSSR